MQKKIFLIVFFVASDSAGKSSLSSEKQRNRNAEMCSFVVAFLFAPSAFGAWKISLFTSVRLGSENFRT